MSKLLIFLFSNLHILILPYLFIYLQNKLLNENLNLESRFNFIKIENKSKLRLNYQIQ